MKLVQIQIARRDFLKASTLAAAAGSLAACQNPERILPLLTPDPRQEAGRPQFFATVCRECPAGCGMVVRVNDGRPTKVEGNPDHPVNRGKLCLRGQTAVQGLYNPDRLRQPRLRDPHGNLRPVDWNTALGVWRQQLARAGASLLWLGQLETGALDGVIRQWLSARGAPAPLYYEAFSYDSLRRAYQLTRGQAVVPTFHLDRAKYLVSFGAEFLETYISNVEFAGDYAAMHSLGHTPTPARFLAIGPRLSLTAANADEFWPARPGSEALLAQALLGLVTGTATNVNAAAQAGGIAGDVIRRAAQRLRDHRPSLVLGPGYATDTRAALDCQIAVNRLNDALGNTGVTVLPDQPHALTAVADQEEVRRQLAALPGMLLLHHANPLYHHPAWEPLVRAIPFKVSFASWMDETTQHADLILPDHHFLESWGDYSPRPGLTGMLQPARIPLYDTRPTADLLLGAPFADRLRQTWTTQLGGAPHWNALLQKGVNTSANAIATPPQSPAAPSKAVPVAPAAPAAFDGDGDFYLVAFPSIQFFDGRQANRSWAQEIAEPLSKLAWDGWCELHPDTAHRLGLEPSDVVRLTSPHGSAEFPVFITTWIRPDCVGVLLGQGHTNFGMWANGRGDSVHKLQDLSASADGLWHAQTVTVHLAKTGKRRDLANLQQQHLQYDKKMALAVTYGQAAHPPVDPSL
ncbi:MAG TPA: molybdopterin dinucleotide binding domain-containing protein, partial [Terriglobales bacterium]|nr:molybdopterin dinucleotide binding domain-containing protein [Terriglobales bacterium]